MSDVTNADQPTDTSSTVGENNEQQATEQGTSNLPADLKYSESGKGSQAYDEPDQSHSEDTNPIDDIEQQEKPGNSANLDSQTNPSDSKTDDQQDIAVDQQDKLLPQEGRPLQQENKPLSQEDNSSVKAEKEQLKDNYDQNSQPQLPNTESNDVQEQVNDSLNNTEDKVVEDENEKHAGETNVEETNTVETIENTTETTSTKIQSDPQVKLDAESLPLEDDLTTEEQEQEQPTSYELDLINKKRQEEKEVFQKLIDDVTKLEHEKEKLNATIEELNMKLDVCKIELDTEKDNAQDQRRQMIELEQELKKSTSKHEDLENKRILQLETAVERYEELLKRVETVVGIDKLEELKEDQNISTEPTIPQESDHRNHAEDDETRNLHMRIKMMVQNDETKSQQIERLESAIKTHEDLLSKVEKEIGAEKLNELQDHQIRNGNHQIGNGERRPKSNEVGPDTPESKVCIIL